MERNIIFFQYPYFISSFLEVFLKFILERNRTKINSIDKKIVSQQLTFRLDLKAIT